MNSSGVEVFVNVYDLNPDLNARLYPIGLGLYHSGVQVGMTEYTFGQHEGSGTGVMEVTPKDNHPNFRQSISLGRTQLSQAAIISLLDKLRSKFLGRSYHIVRRNCNSFGEAFAQGLLGRGLPSWINRMANIGKVFHDISAFFTMEKDQGDDLPQFDNPKSSNPFSGKGVAIG